MTDGAHRRDLRTGGPGTVYSGPAGVVWVDVDRPGVGPCPTPIGGLEDAAGGEKGQHVLVLLVEDQVEGRASVMAPTHLGAVGALPGPRARRLQGHRVVARHLQVVAPRRWRSACQTPTRWVHESCPGRFPRPEIDSSTTEPMDPMDRCSPGPRRSRQCRRHRCPRPAGWCRTTSSRPHPTAHQRRYRREGGRRCWWLWGR